MTPRFYLQNPQDQERLAALWTSLEDCLSRYEFERALEHYEKLLGYLGPLSPREGLEDQKAAVRLARAELLMRLGRWDHALEDIDRILASSTSKQLDVNLTVGARLAHAQISSFYGDFGESVSTLEKAAQEARTLPQERALMGAVLLELGGVFARIGGMPQGRAKLDELVRLLAPSDGLSQREALLLAAAHNQLGLMGFRERQVEEARRHYLTSLELCRERGLDPRLEAETLRYLGILCNLEGRNRHALQYYQQALKLYTTVQLPLGIAKTYSSVGQACLDLSRHDEALHFMRKALRVCSELGAEAEMAAIYGKLGRLHLHMGDFELAVEVHLRDVEMCRRFGNYRASAHAMHNLGLSYRGKGDTDEALHYLQESLLRFHELGDTSHATRVHLDLARTLLERSRLPEAEEQLSLASRGLQGDSRGQSYGYSRLLEGTMARLREDRTRAEALLREGLALLEPLGASENLADCHFELGQLHRELEQQKKATSHFKQALLLARKLGMAKRMSECVLWMEKLDELALVQLLLEELAE